MKKNLYLFLCLMLLNGIMLHAQSFRDCSGIPDWSASLSYQQNIQIKYSGNIYQTRWAANAGQTPGADAGGPWYIIASCTGTAGVSCATTNAWSNANVYNTNDLVTYNGMKYKARWYSQNLIPGADNNGPWQNLGACGGPAIIVNGQLSQFTVNAGKISTEQTFAVSGASLSGDIVITAPANFEISFTPGIGFSNSLDVQAINNTVQSKIIYVRYKPTVTGTQTGNIVLTSIGTQPIYVAVSGNAPLYEPIVCNDVQAWIASKVYLVGEQTSYNGNRYKSRWYNQGVIPYASLYGEWELMGTCVFTQLTVAPTTIPAFSTLVGTPSAGSQFTINGSSLSSPVQVVAPVNFEISLSASTGYTNSISINPTGGIVNSVIYVRYNPSASGSQTGDVSVSTPGIAPIYVHLSGVATSPWLTSNTLLYSNPSYANIGIGTTNVPSTYLLGVNGKIICKGLKVQFEGWADFVFDEKYKRMSLEETESFIKRYKHLPDFPSEKKVMEEGMNIEEMNVLLLQKIEELTLSLIEQNKRIKELEEKVNK